MLSLLTLPTIFLIEDDSFIYLANVTMWIFPSILSREDFCLFGRIDEFGNPLIRVKDITLNILE
jgi:hypothetical protein